MRVRSRTRPSDGGPCGGGSRRAAAGWCTAPAGRNSRGGAESSPWSTQTCPGPSKPRPQQANIWRRLQQRAAIDRAPSDTPHRSPRHAPTSRWSSNPLGRGCRTCAALSTWATAAVSARRCRAAPCQAAAAIALRPARRTLRRAPPPRRRREASGTTAALPPAGRAGLWPSPDACRSRRAGSAADVQAPEKPAGPGECEPVDSGPCSTSTPVPGGPDPALRCGIPRLNAAMSTVDPARGGRARRQRSCAMAAGSLAARAHRGRGPARPCCPRHRGFRLLTAGE
jgi:hypothetical protein